MQKIVIGILLFIIVGMFFSGLFFLYEARYMNSRASTVTNSFSPENSYVISVPSKAKGDGSQKIRVSVFVLSGQGLGVMGRKVTLEKPQGATMDIGNTQPNTDPLGKAYFDVSATGAGEYYLEVKVDGFALSQKAHLLFE